MEASRVRAGIAASDKETAIAIGALEAIIRRIDDSINIVGRVGQGSANPAIQETIADYQAAKKSLTEAVVLIKNGGTDLHSYLARI